MAEIATIARPYAEAAFDIARESSGAIDAWSEQLALAARITADADMQRLASDPAFGRERYAALLLDVCGKNVTGPVANFLHLLVENGRIGVLAEVVAQFETLKAQASGIKDADVVSAWPLDETQVKALAERLRKRFGCTVNLSVQVDPALIGGVIVTVGDEVYDASVRGKLQDMAYALKR